MPASKSIAIRAACGAMLCNGQSILENYSRCEDAQSTLKTIVNFGAKIENYIKDTVYINGFFDLNSSEIDCFESGLLLRLMVPIAAYFDKSVSLVGNKTLNKRNIVYFEELMQQFSKQIKTNNGYLPLELSGKADIIGRLEIDGRMGSQYLSGCMFAAPLFEKDVEIHVKNATSKPYIDLTMGVLSQFGISVLNKDYDTFFVSAKQRYKSTNVFIENDWSAAAFWLVLGAINGKIELKGMRLDSAQGDKIIIDVLRAAGAQLSENKNTIVVEESKLSFIDFDATDYPDLFPPLSVLACFCSGESRIYGVDRLLHKESNRAVTLFSELTKMGVAIRIVDNWLHIKPGRLNAAVVNSHGDHRIAMALAVLATKVNGQTEIQNADAVAKSFPDFFNQLHKICVGEGQ